MAVDAATTLRVALSNMAAHNPDVFHHVTRNGRHYYNNGSHRRADCDSEPVVPWKYGHDVMKAIRQVMAVLSRSGPHLYANEVRLLLTYYRDRVWPPRTVLKRRL